MARRVSIRVEGLRDAREMIGAVGDRARRPEAALRSPATLDALQDGERRRFGGRFSPRVTREWAARKRRLGLDSRAMRATGALERTLTRGRPPMVRFSAFNGVLTWGLPARSPVWYAAVHARKPGRRTVVIDKKAKTDITQVVAVWIAQGRV